MFIQLIERVAALSLENRSDLLALYRNLLTDKPIKEEDYLTLIEHFPYLMTENQHIVAAFGLDRRPTRHKLLLNGFERFTWCIWDAFFLAQILTDSAEIHTYDPVNNKLLSAKWQQGKWQLSPDFCASFPLKDGDNSPHLRAAFCQFVHLFSNQNSAMQYAENYKVEIVDAQVFLQRSQDMAMALLGSSVVKLIA